MPRRAGLFVFLGLAIALVFVTGISAGAEPDGSIRAKKADVAVAQDRLMEIRMEAGSAEAAYNNALYEMNQLNGQITRTTEDLAVAKQRLAVAKKTLEERATQVYKSGNVAFMDVLVGVDDFSEFASRLNLWVRLLDRERVEFLEVREARNELAARRDRLEAQREQRFAAVETAIAQRERANEAEAQAAGYLDSLNAELRGAIREAQDRQAAQARAAAAMVEKAQEPVEEPEPIPEVQVSQVKQAGVPRADLQSERAAAERKAAARAAAERAERLAEKRAAEREAARKAAEQAAAEREAARLAAAKVARQEAREEAQRQAELAARRAAKRQAAREKAERQAEQAARRAEIEEAAAEQAAAEREAARLAAERRAERRAAERRDEKRAAASASASAAAAEKAAAERRADRRAERRAEASASASAAAEEEAVAKRRAGKQAKDRTTASASASATASASAPSSKDSKRDGGGRGAGDSSASATASASASASPTGGGGVSGLGDDVLAVADDHLGTPYEFSPPGPCLAFEAEDCSCFTMLVFQEFGIALPDSPGGQLGYGTPVHGAPQAGDLLFWSEDGSGYITHVGIAMGDGTTIHAQVHNEVTITSINYLAGYVGARRLL
jgi:peptidoglycan DL-endopeptidase RipA